jgi:hypothetical protein
MERENSRSERTQPYLIPVVILGRASLAKPSDDRIKSAIGSDLSRSTLHRAKVANTLFICIDRIGLKKLV